MRRRKKRVCSVMARERLAIPPLIAGVSVMGSQLELREPVDSRMGLPVASHSSCTLSPGWGETERDGAAERESSGSMLKRRKEERMETGAGMMGVGEVK